MNQASGALGVVIFLVVIVVMIVGLLSSGMPLTCPHGEYTVTGGLSGPAHHCIVPSPAAAPVRR